MNKKIPLHKVFMSEDVLEPVNRTLMSGYIGQGPQVEAFEGLIARFLGNPRVVAVDYATSGLHIALRIVKDSVDEGSRDEVLTTPLTCVATNMPILANGLRPVWVDVDKHTFNLNITDLRRKLSPRTAAIMAVHWGGIPNCHSNLKEVAEECHRLFGYKPLIIEDCAHAFGATSEGKTLGSHGNICVFSFGPVKALTCGEGGAIACDIQSHHEKAKLLRWYGIDRNGSAPHWAQAIDHWGYKSNMTDLTATIGIHNFSHFPALLERQRANALYYKDRMLYVKGRRVFQCLSHNCEPSYWLFTMEVERRVDFQRMMEDCGIETGIVHSRNDTHPCFHEYRVSLPNLDSIAENIVCIPSGWWLTPEDREYIIDCIKGGW